jgi:hypothetical protein
MPRVWTPFARAYERGLRVRDLDRVLDLTNLQLFKARLNLFRVVLLSQPRRMSAGFPPTVGYGRAR